MSPSAYATATASALPSTFLQMPSAKRGPLIHSRRTISGVTARRSTPTTICPAKKARSDSGYHQQSDHHRGDEVPHRVGDRQAEVAQLDREKSREGGLRVDHHEAGAGQCRADHELVLVPGERGEPHT